MTANQRVGGEPERSGGKARSLEGGLLRGEIDKIVIGEELETPRGKTQDIEYEVSSSDWGDTRKGADEPREGECGWRWQGRWD